MDPRCCSPASAWQREEVVEKEEEEEKEFSSDMKQGKIKNTFCQYGSEKGLCSRFFIIIIIIIMIIISYVVTYLAKLSDHQQLFKMLFQVVGIKNGRKVSFFLSIIIVF